MTERQEIKRRIAANTVMLNLLKSINEDLEHEDMLLCDDQQRYTEHQEISKFKENGKWVETERTIGRLHWKQKLIDQDTGKEVEIERSENVRIDGVWLR